MVQTVFPKPSSTPDPPTEMAPAPPSNITYEDAVKAVERWAKIGITDEEKLQFLEDAIKSLNEPSTKAITEQGMVELAVRVVQTGEAFDSALNILGAFISSYGAQFPGIIPFLMEWSIYTSSWRAALLQSANYARQTATEYQAYTSKLQRVGAITNKEEMQKLAAELKEFSKNNPVNIPVDFKDVFLDMKRNIENFQTRLNSYLDQQQVMLTPMAMVLTIMVNSLQSEIDELNRLISAATASLGIASWWELLTISSSLYLQMLILMRNEKQAELYPIQLLLNENLATQTALGRVKALFASLAPDFYNLAVLADAWNSFHNEALDFGSKFEKVETPSSLPSLYIARINAALAASVPLVSGLNAYAAILS